MQDEVFLLLKVGSKNLEAILEHLHLKNVLCCPTMVGYRLSHLI